MTPTFPSESSSCGNVGTCGECRFSRPVRRDEVGDSLPADAARLLREGCVVCEEFPDDPVVTLASGPGAFGPCEDFEPGEGL